MGCDSAALKNVRSPKEVCRAPLTFSSAWRRVIDVVTARVFGGFVAPFGVGDGTTDRTHNRTHQ